MARESTFSWLFIGVIALAALWVVSKLSGPNSSVFTGISSQRGLFGLDQFGNPATPGSTGTASS